MIENITNRELGMLIKNNLEKNELQHQAIMDSQKAFHEKMEMVQTANSEKLDNILVQTTKTNGSVRGLLLWRANLQGKVFIIIALASTLFAGVITIALNYFLK